jgi:chitodextrinase
MSNLPRRLRGSPLATPLVLLFALLAVPAIALAYSGSPPPRTDETLSGELYAVHGDDFAHGRSKEAHVLKTKRGKFVTVDVSHLEGGGRLTGRSVRLVGERRGDVFLAAEGETTSESAATATASTATTTTRRTAVVLLNFTNDVSQPWTPATVSSVMFGATNSVNAFYREVSYGSTAFSGDVFGWVTVPYDNSSCRYGDWATAAAQKLGLDTTPYAHVVYAWPKTSNCGWAGMATLGGNRSWINGSFTVPVVSHELGHNLGVHHASSIACTQNGAPVTLSSTCTTYEYGDPFSVMGQASNSARPMHDLQRGQIGWLPELITLAMSGTYTVAPTELMDQPRLNRIARGDGTFLYLEFRQPYGAYGLPSTSAALTGVTVRVAPDEPIRAPTKLLDTNPSTTSFADAPLAVGKTFTDPASNVSITTTAVSPAGATVSVSFGSESPDTQAPSQPGGFTANGASSSSVSLSWTASTDDLGVAGYRVSRNGTIVTTVTSLSFTDSGLVPGTSYGYSVVAFDAAGNVSPAATASATTTAPPPGDTEAPTAPASLAAVLGKGKQVRLSWTASSDNVGVAGYRVYRNGSPVGTTTATGYADALGGKSPSATYYVVAFDGAGNVSVRSTSVAVS